MRFINSSPSAAMRLDTGERRRSSDRRSERSAKTRVAGRRAVLAARGFKTASMQLLMNPAGETPMIATLGEGTSIAGEVRTDMHGRLYLKPMQFLDSAVQYH
jgi:hypothetical protein